MALVSNPSLDGFNSFVSIEEADSHFEGVYFGPAGNRWAALKDEAIKSSLLITAARKLSSLPWGGSPFFEHQSLAFPRSFTRYSAEYGYRPTPSNGQLDFNHPTWLKQATFEMVHWMLTEDERPATDAEFSMLKGMKIGPLDYQFRDTAMDMPPAVAAILSNLGPDVIDFGNGGPKPMRMYL